MNSSSPDQHDDLHSLHLKLVAKVTLYTGLSAAVVLLVLLFVISEEGQGSYFQIIQAHTATRLQLGSFMLIAALLLLVIVGISVWLISLYSSFRIAGPLYRLSKNLQAAVSFGSQHDIRHDDALQDVAQDLRGSVDTLAQHYQQLHQKVDEALAHLDSQDTSAFNKSVIELKALESAVQLDE